MAGLPLPCLRNDIKDTTSQQTRVEVTFHSVAMRGGFSRLKICRVSYLSLFGAAALLLLRLVKLIDNQNNKIDTKKKQRTLQEMFEGTFAGTKNGTVRFFQVKPAFPVEFPWKMGPPTSSHNELIPTFHPQAIH